MLEIFSIQSNAGSYSVELGIGQLTSKTPVSIHELIIIDLNVSRLWPQLNSHANFSIPVLAIEENKTLFDVKSQAWKYAIRGKAPNRDELRIIVSFLEKMAIITVIRIT